MLIILQEIMIILRIRVRSVAICVCVYAIGMKSDPAGFTFFISMLQMQRVAERTFIHKQVEYVLTFSNQ